MRNSEEKAYEVVQEGSDLILRLKDRYPKIVWTVKPEEVIVLAVSNKDRPDSQERLAMICKLGPAEKKLLAIASSGIKYYIEVYMSDWIQWPPPRKQLILLHELAHVPAPWEKSLVKHDIEDFAFIVDKFGVRWWNRNDLPDLLSGTPVDFNMDYVDSLHSKNEDD